MSRQARTNSWPSSLEYSRYSAAPSQILRARFWRSWVFETGARESRDFNTVRRCEIAGEDTKDWICAAMKCWRMGGEILRWNWLSQYFLEIGMMDFESQMWKTLLGGWRELIVRVWRMVKLKSSEGEVCWYFCLAIVRLRLGCGTYC